MRPDKLFSLGDVLGPKISALAELAKQKVEEGQALVEKVRQALPEHVRPHVLRASWRHTTLMVIVDSGAWSMHVRFAEADLWEALKNAGEPEFTRLWVRVSAPSAAAA